jgi:hypothetical protein
MDQRDQVLDGEQHHVLRVVGTGRGVLGHRRSDDLDIFTGDATLAEAVPPVEAEWRTAGLAVRTKQRYATFTRLWVGERPVQVERAQAGVPDRAVLSSLGDRGRRAHPLARRHGRR